MDDQEQKLIEEIRVLFKELIEEEEGRFDIPTRCTIYPRNHVYVIKAKELYSKALELEKLDSKYFTEHLKDVMGDEVDMVDRYDYEYKKGQNTPKGKSITKMQHLMHNATYHIQLYFYEVLGDIKFK